MSSYTPTNRWLSLPIVTALVLTALAVVVPHLMHLPLWVSALYLATCAWRYAITRFAYRPPPRWLRVVLTVSATLGVLLTFGTITGRDAGVALLSLMTALKLLELREKRDALVALYLCFFLAATQFLYDQSLLLIIYLVAVVWLATAVLISVSRPTAVGQPWQYARDAGKLLVQAIPLMLLLFILVPRVSGPLWGLPEDAHSGVSGLSDSMSPGSISQLSQSDAVAFRVEFEGTPPPRDMRYWRGPVLSAYDGRTWTRSETREDHPEAVFLGGESAYTVYLEPHNQPWLLALDMPAGAPEDARLTKAFEIKADNPVNDTTRYDMRSYSGYRLQPQLSDTARQRLTALPQGAHPRTRALAEQWRDEASTPTDIAARAQRFFRQEPFVYTLRPPRLGREAMDEFLFETRRGFCEHYAGAFTVLMRAAGVPARVVTGYLGGERNPNADYMIVRQSDAHAWVEIWIEGEGWIRYDPTAAVSPDRVEGGLAGAVPEGDPVPAMARPGIGLLKDLRLKWDAVNALWNRWVLGYGPDLQQELMRSIGLVSWQRTALALATTLGATLAIVAFFVLGRHTARPSDPVMQAYRKLGKKLARAGYPPAPNEGPRDYLERVCSARPEWRDELGRIVELYIALRYGGASHPHWQKTLKQRVARFQPRKRGN